MPARQGAAQILAFGHREHRWVVARFCGYPGGFQPGEQGFRV
jgi:hypothetical protein